MEALLLPFAALLSASISAGTPLLLAALGLLLNERAGVLNLGAEGMMLIAAVAGFATAVSTGSATLGLLAGAAAGIVTAWFFSWFVIHLNTNQYATGLALSLFGLGFSAFAGQSFVGSSLVKTPHDALPLLSQIPFLGEVFFSHHPLVYFAIVVAIAMHRWLDRTRSGLILRAIGESPESAHALGMPVRRIRVLALMAGGALCGLAGAYLSVVYTPLWVEGMVAGRGWIALALTVFATWRPLRTVAGAYLFGGATMLQFHLQGVGVDIPSQILTMLPYLATVFVLAAMSRNVEWLRENMPSSLGKPFHP
jgi:general nucleoside transport system permease protein